MLAMWWTATSSVVAPTPGDRHHVCALPLGGADTQTLVAYGDHRVDEILSLTVLLFAVLCVLQGTQIEGSFWRESADKFHDSLEEGKVRSWLCLYLRMCLNVTCEHTYADKTAG
jgi:hypothetical protein